MIEGGLLLRIIASMQSISACRHKRRARTARTRTRVSYGKYFNGSAIPGGTAVRAAFIVIASIV